MRCSLKKLACTLLVILIGEQHSLAASLPKTIPAFEFAAGAMAGKYSDRSYNEVLETGGTQDKVTMSGSFFHMGGRYNNYGLFLSGRSYQPKDLDFWQARNEMDLTLRYYWAKFPWITPVAGYHYVTQSGDAAHAEAPPAFLDKDQTLIFGLQSNFVLFSIGSHGMYFEGHYNYLTTMQKKFNFGNDSGFKVGYAYTTRGKLKMGLYGGQISSFANSSVPDKKVTDKLLHVRHKQITNAYGFFIQY